MREQYSKKLNSEHFLKSENHFMVRGFPSSRRDALFLVAFHKLECIIIPSPEKAKSTLAFNEMLSDSQGGVFDTLHQVPETRSEGLYCFRPWN